MHEEDVLAGGIQRERGLGSVLAGDPDQIDFAGGNDPLLIQQPRAAGGIKALVDGRERTPANGEALNCGLLQNSRPTGRCELQSLGRGDKSGSVIQKSTFEET